MEPLKAYLTQTLGGDTNAFNEVVFRFQEKALSKAYRSLGDYRLAEEAVQEAFLSAFNNLASLRQLNRFPGWFQSILISCIGRAVRNNSVDFLSLNPDELPHSESIPQAIGDDFRRRELFMLVNRAMETLPHKTQAVCRYYYYFGFSLKEISGFLGLPIGTVKRKLHEARRQIREYFVSENLIQGIRVGYMPISDHLLAMVSHQINGDDDFIIDLRKFLSWSSLAKAIRLGLIDVAFIMAPLALNLRIEGVPIRYILDAAHGGSAITVHNAIPSTNALAGAKLGLPLASSTHHLLLHFFLVNESGSVPKDIAKTYLSPSYSISALKSHRIDGFFCAEPWNTKAVYEGIGRILVRSDQIAPDHLCCIIVVNRDYATRHGDILNRYVKLLLAARKLICHHPARCAKIQTRYTGIHPTIAHEVMQEGHISFSNLRPERKEIEKTMHMAVSAGTILSKCKLDGFIYRDCL